MEIKNLQYFLIPFAVIVLFPLWRYLLITWCDFIDEFLDLDYYTSQRAKYKDPYRDELREERKYVAENYDEIIKEMRTNKYNTVDIANLSWAMWKDDYITAYNIMMDYLGEMDNIYIKDGKIYGAISRKVNGKYQPIPRQKMEEEIQEEEIQEEEIQEEVKTNKYRNNIDEYLKSGR